MKAHLPIPEYKVPAPYGPKWIHSRYAIWILAALSFAESVFAPILIDPFLVGMIIANRAKWKIYVLTAITSSIIGGLCAYFIGLWFFEHIGTTLIAAFNAEDSFESISNQVGNNGFVFVLIGAFTPIPYKLVALASGILHISLLTFIVASIVGRIFRLGFVGIAAYALSPRLLPMMQRHHFTVAFVLGGILVSYIMIRIFV